MLVSICDRFWSLLSTSEFAELCGSRYNPGVSHALVLAHCTSVYPHSGMAHPNRSQTDADDIQKLISQYFPQPELLADHPPGAEGYWQPQQRQQEQEQQSTSHPNQQTSLPQQPSLYPPIPPHAAQPWNDSSTTVESGMPARYPQGRSLPEQRSFQDLMRVIQNERVATALPGASSQPYSPSLSHQ